MKLYGTFDDNNCPFLEGVVYIPSLEATGKLAFVVDTGAYATMLGPPASRRMGINPLKLPANGDSFGVGGASQSHKTEAFVAFSAPREAWYWYKIDLDILIPNKETENFPSLLGRDILNRWSMLYDPSGNQLSFMVKEFDAKIPPIR